MSHFPSRIVCLTEETTETLYLLGEGDRVAGVSGYTVRPPEARQKPKVSAFINARFDKIDALKPDLILAFSDLQADIARELIRRGYPVYTFNQRSVAEILQMIRMLGGLVGVQGDGERLAESFERGLDDIQARAARFPRRLRACAPAPDFDQAGSCQGDAVLAHGGRTAFLIRRSPTWQDCAAGPHRCPSRPPYGTR